MALRLPPLSGLRFFEAAGRLMSFKKAAEELNVTPSAVSHGIVALEQALGVTLFVRGPRKLALTPEGADYLTYVSEGLSLIAIGTQRLPSRHAQRIIKVSCAPTMASLWLMPRLPAFQEQWNTVSVSVETSHRLVSFPADGFDFAIRMSRAGSAGPGWDHLFGETLVPVCSPAYRDSHLDSLGAFDLGRARFIRISSLSEDWPAWLEAAGMADLEPVGGDLRVDTVQLAMSAAAAGLGVALARRPLADADLASGALVEAHPLSVPAEMSFWLVGSAAAELRPELRAFRRWILEQAHQPVHQPVPQPVPQPVQR